MYNMNQIKHQEMSLNVEDHWIHLRKFNGVVFLVLAEICYPQQLAFQYLTDLQELFLDECQKKFGSNASVDYGSKIEMVDIPYHFQQMERNVNKLMKDYKDSNSSVNVERLNKELMDINSIMRDNFELILNRETTLTNLSGKAVNLKESSKKYKDNAKKLKMSFYWRKYGTIGAIVGIFLLFIIIKLFVF